MCMYVCIYIYIQIIYTDTDTHTQDPFDQDDWEGYKMFTADIGDQVQVVGDKYCQFS